MGDPRTLGGKPRIFAQLATDPTLFFVNSLQPGLDCFEIFLVLLEMCLQQRLGLAGPDLSSAARPECPFEGLPAGRGLLVPERDLVLVVPLPEHLCDCKVTIVKQVARAFLFRGGGTKNVLR